MGRGKNSLCFDCQNAVCGCSWSKRFEPVEGWVAKPVKLKADNKYNRYIDSYVVEQCPLFIADDIRSLREIFCKLHGISERTFYRWQKYGKVKKGDLKKYEKSNGIQKTIS